jgi:hypothetical protein
MNRIKRWAARLDWGYVVVLLICLIALWPWLSRASLPQETDAELHIFRLAELSYLVQRGEFYPRWAPNFFHGYGYPIFNYYAPLTYYLGLVYELLPRPDAVAGIKFVLVAGTLLAAVCTYGFVRDNWGRRAGYVATAVYLYAPYVQYIDPHARGAVAESLSLGIFPLAIWSLDRLRRQRTFWRLVTAVFATAATILSHNLMGFLFFAILFAWVVWEWAVPKPTSDFSIPAGAMPEPQSSNNKLAFTTVCLGLLLAAFFWLPVILERNAVTLNNLIGQANNYDFHTHFLSIIEMLSPTLRLDWGASQPAFRFNLGAGQWLLGGLGLVMLLARRTRHSARLTFFALAAGVLIFLMLPASAFLWEATPILPFFQFPWRLLGAVAFMLAVLAGAGTAVFTNTARPKTDAALTAFFTLLPILAGLPLSQPPSWPDFDPVHLARVAEIEFKGRWVGTTSTADYVPSTVDNFPRPNDGLMADFYAGRPLDRVNRDTLPEGVSVISEQIRPLHSRYTISATDDFPLRLFLFNFPGWQATIDGEPVTIELGRPEGFIVITIPPGEHVVDVWFGGTPARTLAWAISGAALIITLVLAWKQRGQGQPQNGTRMNADLADWWTLAAVGLVTAVFILILNPLGWLHEHSTGYKANRAETAVFADFGTQIALIGYDAPIRQAEPGDSLPITLYWKAQQPQPISYQVFVHLLAANGSLVAQSDKLNPGDFPTRRWSLDKYVSDEHTLQLPAALLPGTYTVSVGLWNAAEGWRLPLFNPDEVQIGDNFPLFKLEVE